MEFLGDIQTSHTFLLIMYKGFCFETSKYFSSLILMDDLNESNVIDNGEEAYLI